MFTYCRSEKQLSEACLLLRCGHKNQHCAKRTGSEERICRSAVVGRFASVFGLKFKWNHVPGNDCLIFVTSAESDDLPSIHRPVLEHIWAFRCFVSWNPTLFFGHSKISIDPWSIWLLAEFITHVDRQDNLCICIRRSQRMAVAVIICTEQRRRVGD